MTDTRTSGLRVTGAEAGITEEPVTMSDITIKEVDPFDQDAVDQWLDAQNASMAADLPLFPQMSRPNSIVGMLRRSESFRTVRLAAEVDGRIVGSADVTFPLKDNLHLAEFEMDVDPAHRRRGVGTALLRHVLELAKADGRRTAMVYVMDTLDPERPRNHAGQDLLRAFGFTRGTDEIRRVADLDLVPESELDELLADAWKRAEGYELVQWINRTPDELVDGVAYLDGRLLMDAPTGDLDIEPQKVDADRVRDTERNQDARGVLRVHTAIRHVASGALAGWTEIVVPAGQEDHAWQNITLVDPDHRGHRLGTILKIANHRWLREWRPRMKYVQTWNDEANPYMIAINEAVGYRAQERWIAMQLKMEDGG